MGLTKANYQKEVKRHSVQMVTSWDDGAIEDLRVAEILQKFGVRGTFFVVVDNVGNDGFMSWKDLRTLDDNKLFDIGSHTVSHPMDLKLLFDEDLFFELQNSKDMLETVFNHRITKFCYPRGRHNERVREAVKRAGYTMARTTLVGHIEKAEDPLQTPTTVHVYDGRPEYRLKDWLPYAKEQFDLVLQNPGGKVFHLWGHGKEIEQGDEWSNLVEFFEYASSKANLVGEI